MYTQARPSGREQFFLCDVQVRVLRVTVRVAKEYGAVVFQFFFVCGRKSVEFNPLSLPLIPYIDASLLMLAADVK